MSRLLQLSTIMSSLACLTLATSVAAQINQPNPEVVAQLFEGMKHALAVRHCAERLAAVVRPDISPEEYTDLQDRCVALLLAGPPPDAEPQR